MPSSFKMIPLLFVFVTAVFGQTNNFEFEQHDMDYSGSEDFVVLHGEIMSLSAATQSLTVTRVTHDIPSAWTNSFCVGPACLPPFLDTFTFDLAGGDTAEFTLDTYPNGELGMGSWTIFVVDSATMEVDSAQITMEYVAVDIDPSFARPQAFELSAIYPNPTNASINFDLDLIAGGNYSVVLYALDGRQLLSRNYDLNSGRNQLQWAIHGLTSGNYIIRATGGGSSFTRQVSVIK
mgnify:CR=1 FL=1